VLTVPRGEGGAVKLSFTLAQDFSEVRVLRVLTGVSITGPTDPTATLVFDGVPDAGESEYYTEVSASPPPRGEVWDLQAFPDDFEDISNLIEDVTFDYYLYPSDGVGGYGIGSLVSGVTPTRTISTEFVLNVKDLAYQRARLHARNLNIFAAKMENLHDREPPALLIKTRATLTSIDIGVVPLRGTNATTCTFRTIMEFLLITRTPRERDDYGDTILERLLGDLTLFGALGLDELSIQYTDGLELVGEEPFYTREISVSGLVDALIKHSLPLNIGDIQVSACP